MSLTNYAENRMLGLFSGNATYYLALFLDDPGETGSFDDEVVGGDYARKPISFAEPSGGEMTNDSPIMFDTASADWGTITHWGICDAAVNGNIWWYGPVTESRSVYTGDIYVCDTEKLVLTID